MTLNVSTSLKTQDQTNGLPGLLKPSGIEQFRQLPNLAVGIYLVGDVILHTQVVEKITLVIS